MVNKRLLFSGVGVCTILFAIMLVFFYSNSSPTSKLSEESKATKVISPKEEVLAQESILSTATLENIKGEVYIIKKDSNDEEQIKASNETKLVQGDRIVTKQDSSVRIVFNTDQKTLLGENSNVIIKELHDTNIGLHTVLTQVSGSLMSMGKHDDYTVETDGMTVTPNGTNFYVTIDPTTQQTTIFVASGIVSARPQGNQGLKQVDIYPSQQISVNPQSNNDHDITYGTVDIPTLVSIADPVILEGLLKNKAEIDKENQELVEELNGNTTPPPLLSDPALLREYLSNIQNMLGNLVLEASKQNKFNKEEIENIIDEANKETKDLNNKIDLDNVKPIVDLGSMNAKEVLEAMKKQQEANTASGINTQPNPVTGQVDNQITQEKQKKIEEQRKEMEQKKKLADQLQKQAEEQNKKKLEEIKKKELEKQKKKLEEIKKKKLEEQKKLQEQLEREKQEAREKQLAKELEDKREQEELDKKSKEFHDSILRLELESKVTKLIDLKLKASDGVIAIDLSSIFINTPSVTYQIMSADTKLVTGTIQNSQLLITPVSIGETKLTFVVKSGDVSVTKTFNVLVEDVPQNGPVSLKFYDNDPVAGQLGGEINLIKAEVEDDITGYVYYWVDDSKNKLGIITTVDKSDVRYTLPMSTLVPEGATGILAVSRNQTGESSAYSYVLINDLQKMHVQPIENQKLMVGQTKLIDLSQTFIDVTGGFIDSNDSLFYHNYQFEEETSNEEVGRGYVDGGFHIEGNQPGTTQITITLTNRNTRESVTTSFELVVEELPLPDYGPGKLTFIDMNPLARQLSGTINLEKAEDEAIISSYVFYWANSKKEKIGDKLVEIDKTGENMTYSLPPTDIVNEATGIVAVSKNNTGESSLYSYLEIIDLQQLHVKTPIETQRILVNETKLLDLSQTFIDETGELVNINDDLFYEKYDIELTSNDEEVGRAYDDGGFHIEGSLSGVATITIKLIDKQSGESVSTTFELVVEEKLPPIFIIGTL
ncbi:FecR domain-containing protein [Litchfieldia salsa]|uniref:FecR protein n=1 Tax=Litchfieldia salsa TaxID=930152 RepID=A0A1H0WSL3_9BACI|nr:FecR domain-containing protein [Litchfieldia salsa]SDP93485.1 FecR protein [Litchfieldia salsa]